MEDASAYIEFILRTMQSRDLFHSIRIEPTSCWEYLLWMDQVPFPYTHTPTFSYPDTPFQVNYGGVRVKLPSSLRTMYGEEENSEATNEEEVGVASTPNDPEVGVAPTAPNEEEVEMNWSVCNFLPEAGSCQDIFRVMVAAHIHALFSHEVEGRRNHAPGSTPIQRRLNTSVQSQVCVCVCMSVCVCVTLSLPFHSSHQTTVSLRVSFHSLSKESKLKSPKNYTCKLRPQQTTIILSFSLSDLRRRFIKLSVAEGINVTPPASCFHGYLARTSP